ncbi:MAG: polyprenyl synthetase family protein [Lentisphaeria bacterium]|jgi:geranylgeranyl diphosphate synthase type I
MPAPNLAEALQDVSERLDRLLATATLPTTVRPAALAEAVLAYPRRGGKRLRPALLLWSCGAVGGDPEPAWPAALAVELYHNWTLVHDDIIDGDETRRGRPACHVLLRAACPRPAEAAKFGADLAILAGDIQHGWAAASLAAGHRHGVRAEVVLALLERLHGWLTPALISGEALDVEFACRPPGAVPAAALEEMMAGKTGALLQFCAEAGAMIGLDETDPAHPLAAGLGRFARQGGIAFQLIDDWLGLFGDEARLGKPVGADLREGKQTLLLALGLERLQGPDRAELLAMVGRPGLPPAAVERARALLRGCGAEAELLARARTLAAQAAAELQPLAATPYRALLAAWLDALVHRTA